MIIFVEAGRLSTTHFTGISNVIAQALIAWADASPNDQFVVCSHSSFSADFLRKAETRANISLRIDPVPAFVPNGARNAFWFYFRVPSLVREVNPTLYWASSSLVPFALPSKTLVLTIVYDLVPLLYRHTMTRKGRLLTALSYRHSIRRADMLWTISHYVKDELLRRLPASHGKPIAVACAVDHDQFQPRNMEPEAKRLFLNQVAPGHPGGKTLLFVGTAEPRKNLKFLLSLMPALAKQGISLIVVGARGWGLALDAQAKAIASDPANHVFFAGRISNDELTTLYGAADLLVSTSLDEGFCMPAVEAMACGTPVLLARNSAMVEVADKSGRLVEGWDPNTWISGITTAFNGSESKPSLLLHARHYRWPERISSLTNLIAKLPSARK